jgi:TPR repeat protein
MCYLYGDGVATDNDKAFYYFTKAANQGYWHGQLMLGTCYQYGWGTAQSNSKAREMYKKVMNNSAAPEVRRNSARESYNECK